MSTELFTIIDAPKPVKSTALPLCKEVAWDFETNTPRFERGSPAIVTGKEAVKVWAWKALHVPRFRHEMYSRNYGSELQSLIGQPYSAELKRAEAIRYVREALTINPYISSVDDISVEFEDGKLSIFCKVNTIYGDSEVSASV